MCSALTVCGVFQMPNTAHHMYCPHRQSYRQPQRLSGTVGLKENTRRRAKLGDEDFAIVNIEQVEHLRLSALVVTQEVRWESSHWTKGIPMISDIGRISGKKKCRIIYRSTSKIYDISTYIQEAFPTPFLLQPLWFWIYCWCCIISLLVSGTPRAAILVSYRKWKR